MSSAFANSPAQKLRLRWYKITGEHDAASLGAQASRAAAPAAGHHRRRHQRSGHQAGPCGCKKHMATIRGTFAGAAYHHRDRRENQHQGSPLIGVYPRAYLRFSFTNQKMVESLLKFVACREFPDKDKTRRRTCGSTSPPMRRRSPTRSPAWPARANFGMTWAILSAASRTCSRTRCTPSPGRMSAIRRT